MKTQLIALFLLALTALGIGFYPGTGNSTQQLVTPSKLAAARSPAIEVVFVLDTTGSMSGLIDAAKEKIWSIVTSMASAQPAPRIRLGLVAFRDRGDDYVTRVTDLSADLDSVYATLMDYQANGGGDSPESVNAALGAALEQMSWSQDPHTYRVMFLVGDAPPHMDYRDEARYPELLATANARGIVVNTIRCGTSPDTERAWREIAALTQGEFFSVEQSGSAIAIATPYDEALAALSAELDGTRLYYGDELAKAASAAKAAATEKLHEAASLAARARRATFNALESGRDNLFGDNDLVGAVASGETKLEDVPEEALPAPVQALAPELRADYLQRQAKKRDELDAQIQELAAKRDAYLSDRASTMDAVEESLDYRVFEAVRSQAAAKGLVYEAEAPKL